VSRNALLHNRFRVSRKLLVLREIRTARDAIRADPLRVGRAIAACANGSSLGRAKPANFAVSYDRVRGCRA
jgi:hypothetical protein